MFMLSSSTPPSNYLKHSEANGRARTYTLILVLALFLLPAGEPQRAPYPPTITSPCRPIQGSRHVHRRWRRPEKSGQGVKDPAPTGALLGPQLDPDLGRPVAWPHESQDTPPLLCRCGSSIKRIIVSAKHFPSHSSRELIASMY